MHLPSTAGSLLLFRHNALKSDQEELTRTYQRIVRSLLSNCSIKIDNNPDKNGIYHGTMKMRINKRRLKKAKEQYQVFENYFSFLKECQDSKLEVEIPFSFKKP